MQDVYDFFFDVNRGLVERDLVRLDDMLRPAIMSGLNGVYPQNQAKSGTEGVEIKTTRKRGGAVDTHGARDQWMCVFVYEVDIETEPVRNRAPMTFLEIYLGQVTREDFRNNARGELGTRTSTLHKDGIEKLRSNWVYKSSG